MSLQDDLTAVQRCLDDLVRTVGRLEQQLDGGLDIRRVRTDTEHLRDSLALLREAAPEQAAPKEAAPARSDVIRIPDQPYDRSLWSDVDDEGLGARGRRAP